MPAWKCGCARAGQLTATRAPRATRAPPRHPPNPYRAWLAAGAANREGASILGLVAADELSVFS